MGLAPQVQADSSSAAQQDGAAAALAEGPASWEDTAWQYCRSIYFLLSGGLFPPGTTLSQAMSMIETQYRTYGIPPDLSPLQRYTLATTILSTQTLMLTAPPSMDPQDVAVFQDTLKAMYNDLVAPPFPL